MITRKRFLTSTLTVSVAAAAAATISCVKEGKATEVTPEKPKADEPEAPPHVSFAPLKPERIAAIAAMLPEAPQGFGPTCKGDRDAWEALGTRPAFASVVGRAEGLLTDPFPDWSDDLYLEYSRDGKRPTGEQMIGRRHGFLAPLVYAECLENKGRFVPRIETILHGYVADPTWTLPAHDADLKSFHGTQYFVDLGASLFGAELAQTLYLLNGVISDSVHNEVMAALEKRVFAPVRNSYETGKGHWWLTTTNNWNAVCLAGVTSAALAVLPRREDRAFFAAGAERYSRNSIDGFNDDGYCTEGLGYYNYGFGNYLILRAALWQATSGKIDLFADDKLRRIATFGPRMEIENSVWPAIADCRFGTKVDKEILGYCSRALGLGLTAYENQDYAGPSSLLRGCREAFAEPTAKSSGSAAPPVGTRSFFDASGVLVVRPAAGSTCRLGAALKGGHNAESHNHNDVGSFTLVLGKESIVGDPGGPYAYNSKTFGPERYTAFKLFASYGHPVPLLAGKQQRPGRDAAARVLRTDFGDTTDTIAMDIAAAYPPGTLESLVRTFRYDRSGAGSLAVEDAFAFPGGAAQPVEIALTTHGDWKQTAPDTLTFTQGSETVAATIAVPEGAGGFTVTSEVIREDCLPFNRLGLRLNQPLASGKVTVTFRPAATA